MLRLNLLVILPIVAATCCGGGATATNPTPWVSNWTSPREMVNSFDVDPLDDRVFLRGNGELNMTGDGLLRMIGSPRHYILSDVNESPIIEWSNVEMSAFVWLPDGQFSSSSDGFSLATRSGLHLSSTDGCKALTYYLKFKFSNGALGLLKQFHDNGNSSMNYYADGSYISSGSYLDELLVTQQFVGFKLIVQTRSDMESVRLRAFVDVTTNATGTPDWELVHEFNDTGTWEASASKFTPGVDTWPCAYPFTPPGVQDYATPILSSGAVSFFRTDGVNELLVKDVSVVEINAETSIDTIAPTATPSMAPTTNPSFAPSTTSPTTNSTTTPESWVSAWSTPRKLIDSHDVDPVDARVILRGNGELHMNGDGLLRMIDSPRHYILSDIDQNSQVKWNNVEMSAYVWLPDGVFNSSSAGFSLGTRSGHHLYTTDGCLSLTYYLKLRFTNGAVGFLKEFHDDGNSETKYYTDGVYIPSQTYLDPLLVTRQFVGVKLIVQTRADTTSVRLQAFLDLTTNATGTPNWTPLIEFNDTGSWQVSDDKFTVGADTWPCPYSFTPPGVEDYATPILSPGGASFFRTDSVNELLVKDVSVVEIEPEPVDTKEPTKIATEAPTGTEPTKSPTSWPSASSTSESSTSGEQDMAVIAVGGVAGVSLVVFVTWLGLRHYRKKQFELEKEMIESGKHEHVSQLQSKNPVYDSFPVVGRSATSGTSSTSGFSGASGTSAVSGGPALVLTNAPKSRTSAFLEANV